MPGFGEEEGSRERGEGEVSASRPGTPMRPEPAEGLENADCIGRQEDQVECTTGWNGRCVLREITLHNYFQAEIVPIWDMIRIPART